MTIYRVNGFDVDVSKADKIASSYCYTEDLYRAASGKLFVLNQETDLIILESDPNFGETLRRFPPLPSDKFLCKGEDY